LRLSFCLCFTFFILIFYFCLWGVPHFAFYLFPRSQFCLTFHITTRKHGICRPIFWKAHHKIACKTFFCLVDHSFAATSKVSGYTWIMVDTISAHRDVVVGGMQEWCFVMPC
jgi:hypothetical protein